VITAWLAMTVANPARMISAGRNGSGAIRKNQSWLTNRTPRAAASSSRDKANAPCPR
jgi:hypothetical protein